jgi:hypothetical protein
VIGTYAAALAICATSVAIGQAAIALCGYRSCSWLAPPVGLALVLALCWGTVRLPGEGALSALALALAFLGSLAYLWGRLEGGGEAWRAAWPVALIALAAASLPFAVEGHFGILGTSFNPDMSQHLLAAARLAEGNGSQLLHQGYPLGPHAVVVALNEGLGIGLVQGFSGLTMAALVLAPLTALGAFAEFPALPRSAGALLVGLAYLLASYFAQGAFKEVLEALFVLAFALALRESARPGWRELPLRFVPAALIAVGAVYSYSFPGLLWLLGTAVLWVPLQRSARRRALLRPALLAGLLLLVFAGPEVGRMIDFHRFETFNPNGPGLGNLFGRISPLEALGIWPSGDFRLAPGDGAVPAIGYYLGAAFGLLLLAHGLACLWHRREPAILAGLGAAALAYLAARIGGTAYTAAKAVEIAAPLAALTIVLPLCWRGFPSSAGGAAAGALRGAGDPDAEHPSTVWAPAATGPAGARLILCLYALAAGACALLALANAPVGPTSYSPALAELRPLLAAAPTLAIASPRLLADEHGTPYLAWELRGGRVCVASSEEAAELPPGVRFVLTEGGAGRPPFPGLRLRRLAPPYALWEATGPISARSPCPLIAVRQARQGPAR